MRALGWKRDPLDVRDAKFSFAALSADLPSPPPAYSLRDRVVKILNQGSAGTCVACAGMQNIRIAHVGALLALTGSLELARQSSVLGSILWGYFFARVPSHTTDLDSGCHNRGFYSAVSKLGLPPEEVWPYSDRTVPGSRMFVFPSKAAFRAAYDQRCVTGYHRIDSTGEQLIRDVRSAIASGRAVQAGWQVSEKFVDEGPGKTLVGPLQPGEPVAGGHAMLIVGYDQNELLVCNSWGPGWGDGGFFRATYEWLEQAQDLWTVDSSPLFSEET